MMDQDCNSTEPTIQLYRVFNDTIVNCIIEHPVYYTESHTICMMHVAIDLHWIIIIKDWIGHADHHGPE